MAITSFQAAELYADAAALEREGRYAESRDAFLVVSDAMEEAGDASLAREARIRSLRNHVLIWARQRWPEIGDELFPLHIAYNALGQPSRHARAKLVIRRYPFWARVTVGRRGDVRLVTERWS